MSQSIYVNSNLWYIDQNIKLKIKLGIYQNILIFFNDNDILFLSEMKLDFTQIPFLYHGSGDSKTLIEYLSNNSDNNDLIYRFLQYFLFTVTKI